MCAEHAGSRLPGQHQDLHRPGSLVTILQTFADLLVRLHSSVSQGEQRFLDQTVVFHEAD